MRNLKLLLLLLSLLITAVMAFDTSISWCATTIYGPRTFTRTWGKPTVFREPFTAPSATANYVITVVNGEDGRNKVASAAIRINGVQILEDKDLRRHGSRIERNIRIRASNFITVELKGTPGGFITIIIACLDCMGIRITSPADGATVVSPVLVKGSITATEEVRVSVNGLSATVDNSNWAIQLPLEEGANTITATALGSGGDSAQISLNVVVMVPSEGISLVVSPQSGLPPLSVTLSITTLLNPPPVSYQIDFEGDQVIDMTEQAIDNLTHTYSQEGLYYPTVIASDDQGNTHQATSLVYVMNRERMDGALQGKWEAMKTSIMNQDIEGTVSYVTADTQDHYRRLLTALQPVLSRIAHEMANAQLELVSMDEHVAEYAILVTREGVPYSFSLKFIKDADGIWRIWRY